MRCEDLRAYLDNEMNLLGRLMMRAHIRRCARCRENAAAWSDLSCKIKRLEDEPVSPALRERLVADAISAAAKQRIRTPQSKRQRITETTDMRRAAIVFALAAVMIIGWSLVPSRHRRDVAFADVAKAMAEVKTVHYVGSQLGSEPPPDGRRMYVEGWSDAEGRSRIDRDGRFNQLLDNERNIFLAVFVEKAWTGVWIMTKKDGYDPKQGKTNSAQWFSPEFWQSLSGKKIPGIEMKQETATLPDGKPGILITMLDSTLNDPKLQLKYKVTIDTATNRVIKTEYWSNGLLSEEITKIDYNVELPKDIFEVSVQEIPEGRQMKASDMDSQADPDLVLENLGEKRAQILVDKYHQEFQVRGRVKLLPSGTIVENEGITYTGDKLQQ